MNSALVLLGKTISLLSTTLGRGNGSTWPGHVALNINKNFIKQILEKSKTKVIYIAGTNGKTTTSKMIQTILEKNGYKVFQNSAGANLLNGIASAIIQNSSIRADLPYDYAVFEIDENTLPLAIKAYQPDYLLLLNLFRDQLDRYGEVNSIALKWSRTMEQLSSRTIVVLNADDPQIAFLGNKDSKYFGLNNPKLGQTTHQHASDSTYCPNCQTKLNYATVYYSHVGEWQCPKCKLTRPKLDLSDSPIFPLPGTYNKYNTIAAVLVAKLNNVNNETIEQSLQGFVPAFGRQEKIIYKGKRVQIFLSKNPASFNESLRTIKELNGKNVLLVLNDRIPDGRDISWIWDVDFEEFISPNMNITVSGDRTYDMALRMKYAGIKKVNIESNLSQAIEPHFAKPACRQDRASRGKQSNNETLFILATYSAMLEVRKILTGRRIL